MKVLLLYNRHDQNETKQKTKQQQKYSNNVPELKLKICKLASFSTTEYNEETQLANQINYYCTKCCQSQLSATAVPLATAFSECVIFNTWI